VAKNNPDLSFGEALLEGLQEAAAWKRGEAVLETVNVNPMPPERVRAIRRKVSKSARDFERRFGIPAATLSNWEQGWRTPDLAARVLLRVIERDPDAILRVMSEG
jgi:putative transcriptional regulator